jgi:hypothetical protein
MNASAALDTLLARQEVNDLLARYCRGVDRCDVETLKAVFWPEATTKYGDAVTNAWEWAEGVASRLKSMLRTQHAISNALVELDGDQGRGETYCRAYHEAETPGGRVVMMVGGRYLDRYERRQGVWKIIHRTYVMDWNSNDPSTAQWDGPMYGRLSVRGSRFPEDPLYLF